MSRGHTWLLTFDEYATLIADGVGCFYCGNPLNSTGSGLDRLDDTKPYALGNVVPSCWPCNFLRSRGAFTPEEMQRLGPILGPIWDMHPPHGTAHHTRRLPRGGGLSSSKYGLPGTEPQMAMDGSWYQITGPCAQCGHPILWHGLSPWRCQNADCKCPPITKRKRSHDDTRD